MQEDNPDKPAKPESSSDLHWHLRAMQHWGELVADLGPRSPLWEVVMKPGEMLKTTPDAKFVVDLGTRKVVVDPGITASEFACIMHSPGGTAEERAAKLAAIYDEQRRSNRWRAKQHVLRKMTLDLVCASFPPGHPPPKAVVDLLRRALDLPENHQVGEWPLSAGHHDDRGGVDHEVRTIAMLKDHDYLIEHDDYMPVHRLAKLVKKELGREPDRKQLRRWRDYDPEWWPVWKEEPRPPPKSRKQN